MRSRLPFLGRKVRAGFLLLDADLSALRRVQATIEATGATVIDWFLSITGRPTGSPKPSRATARRDV